MSYGRSRLVFIIVLIVAPAVIGSAFPFESSVVPSWKIRVVDESGKPYARMKVSQAWKHYSLELEDGENMESLWTDDAGYVEFPERTLKLSLLSRTLLTSLTYALTLLHSSTGISADVAATGPQGYKSVEYVPGKPPPKQLVLHSKE
jgi:hypothetical protein